MTQKWEYTLFDLGAHAHARGTQAKLNELGDEGWELIAYVGYQELDSLVLKRPKQTETEVSQVPDEVQAQ